MMNRTLLAIRTTSTVNRLLYYTSKLPLIGRRIPDTIYAIPVWKQAFTILAWIANVLWGVGNRFAYLGLMVYLPTVIAFSDAPADGNRLALFLHIYLLLSFIAAGVSSAKILEPNRDKYVAVKLMRMRPDVYMRTTLLYRYVTYFLYYIPVLAVFLYLLDASILVSPVLAAALTLWRVLCEYAHLKLFERTGRVLVKENLIVWLTIGICYGVAYAPLLWPEMWVLGDLPLLWLVLILLAAAGLYAAARLALYDDYRTIVDAATKRDDPLLNIGQMMSDAQKTAISADASHYETTAQTGKHEHREGFGYLNALFFARHRSLFVKPIYKRLLIIAALGAAGIAFALFADEAQTAILTDRVLFALRILPITMSLLTIGEPACRAMFYHCDLSLMRYSFYRNAADHHFRIRLFRVAGLNLMTSTALCYSLTFIVIAAGGAPASELLLLWGCALALSLFFSIHHLFMYYIFQPYTTELNVKNPFYWITNMVISAASGFILVVTIAPAVLAWTILSLTLIYGISALTLVRRYARHTFRVK